MYKKPVIVFEGTEGSGKTFHSNYVSKYLQKKGLDFVKIREPGGSINSEKIRKLILNSKSNFSSYTDLLLYLSARSENMIFLRKNYKKKIILIDRFVDSTIAYQHYGMGLDLGLIKKLNSFLLKDFKVDFTFLHLVSYKNMKKRLNSRKKLNRYDKFKDIFYKKVQKGFIDISKRNKTKYKIIDSDLDIDLNKKIIQKKIDRLIS
ncbi:dTMP kinase [Candidatus Pelagibacter sp.]|nr:dTMP kinase [Candidatus Pelagibacter sp.]